MALSLSGGMSGAGGTNNSALTAEVVGLDTSTALVSLHRGLSVLGRPERSSGTPAAGYLSG